MDHDLTPTESIPPSATVGTRQLQKELKRYVDLAKAGGVVLITVKGKPHARIVACEPPRMEALIRDADAEWPTSTVGG